MLRDTRPLFTLHPLLFIALLLGFIEKMPIFVCKKGR